MRGVLPVACAPQIDEVYRRDRRQRPEVGLVRQYTPRCVGSFFGVVQREDPIRDHESAAEEARQFPIVESGGKPLQHARGSVLSLSGSDEKLRLKAARLRSCWLAFLEPQTRSHPEVCATAGESVYVHIKHSETNPDIEQSWSECRKCNAGTSPKAPTGLFEQAGS